MPRWDDEDFSPLMQLRRSCGLTREQAGVALGCSLSAMIRYERGRTPVPFRVQKRMVELFRVDPGQLYQVLTDTYAGIGHSYEDPNVLDVEVHL